MSSAFGYRNTASGWGSSVFGSESAASGFYSSAFGSRSVARGIYSTAMGYQAVADVAGVVSFGHAAGDLDRNGNAYTAALTPRLINVGEGINATDAVNKGQMDAAIAGLGGGAAASTAYTDAREVAIRTDMTAADAATLAASKTYADTRATAAVNTANAYTDARFAAWNPRTATMCCASITDARFAAWNDTFGQYRSAVDARFTAIDKRISQIGAMSGAMSAAAMNTAGLQGDNRVGIGLGSQEGRAAVAIGYQRVIGGRASFSLGGAFSGGENSVNAGAGFSW